MPPALDPGAAGLGAEGLGAPATAGARGAKGFGIGAPALEARAPEGPEIERTAKGCSSAIRIRANARLMRMRTAPSFT